MNLSRPISTIPLPDEITLAGRGVYCDNFLEELTLAIPRKFQIELLGGDLRKIDKYENDRIHRHLFMIFNLDFDKEWEMENRGEYTIFRQLISNSLLRDEE
jgi:hypothetical protein